MFSGGDGGGGGGNVAGPPQHLDWKFSQVFGERAAGEEVQEGKTFSTTLIFSALLPSDPSSVCVSDPLGFTFRFLICFLLVNRGKLS